VITEDFTLFDENEQPSSLADVLPKEMARVRDEVMPAYKAIGAAGSFALALMRKDLDLAAKALAEGDTVMMIKVYNSLKEYKT